MNLQRFDFDLTEDCCLGDSETVPQIPGMVLAVAVAITAFAVLALLLGNRLRVELEDWSFFALAGSFAGLAGMRFALRGAISPMRRRLKYFAECLLAFVVISALCGIASYAVASITAGFEDARLEAADRMLGFDWLEWYSTVVRHPLLQSLGSVAYLSVYVSPIFLIGAYAWRERLADARRFLLTFWLGAVLTLALFPLFPARGALSFLWHGPVPYMPVNGVYQAAIIPALRDHAMTVIDLATFRGLVCAPSFHTVCGVLFIAFAWPMLKLRWGLVPLNLAMLAATPVEGTHYLTDMLIGAAVALIAIAAVRFSLRLFDPRGANAAQVLHSSLRAV